MSHPPVLAVGLMSGTSMDGVDAALIETDGERVAWTGPALTLPYDPAFREELRAILGQDPLIRPPAGGLVERLTARHAEAVSVLLAAAGRAPADISVIGFHGHTVLHRPDLGVTRQIGDAAQLALETGIDVVCDLRVEDVRRGGEGAPLVPVYHRALAAGLERPLAVLNLGGVGNVTWISGADDLLAFDTGPGNALLDDWMLACTGLAMDRDGALAAGGTVDEMLLKQLMRNDFFDKSPPKSLDRRDFGIEAVAGLSAANGAATLAAFTVHAAARAASFFPRPAKRWLVTGGGRRNPVIMRGLRNLLRLPVDPVEAVGWDGDALEAQAFAFLAVRSQRGLPITFPGTTGVSEPLTGGRTCRAAEAA